MVTDNTNSSDHRKGTIRAVICDYGEVLCHRPKGTDFARMAALLDVDTSVFERLYERNRGFYDRGLMSGAEYWSSFAIELHRSIDLEMIENLRALDVEMWTVTDARMIDWVVRLRRAGFQTVLLSNMHADLVGRVRKSEWINDIDHQILSSEIGLAKPEPAIFLHCLERIGMESHQVLFVDDREENILAAKAVGIHSVRLQSMDAFRGDLERFGFPVLPAASSF